MKKTLILAGASIIALSTAASAASLKISGGTYGAIPGGTAVNDVLDQVYGISNLDGWFGSKVTLEGGDAKVTADFIGFEAGFKNSFSFGGNTFSTEDETNNVALNALNANIDEEYSSFGAATTLGTFSVNALQGLLAFSFTAITGGNQFVGTVNNGDANMNDANHVNFFAQYGGNDQTVYLFFDDTGAGNDDNHDDIVVRLTLEDQPGAPNPVPLPAAGFLLMGALGGLGLAKRRKA